jgi:hypothetical protein
MKKIGFLEVSPSSLLSLHLQNAPLFIQPSTHAYLKHKNPALNATVPTVRTVGRLWVRQPLTAKLGGTWVIHTTACYKKKGLRSKICCGRDTCQRKTQPFETNTKLPRSPWQGHMYRCPKPWAKLLLKISTRQTPFTQWSYGLNVCDRGSVIYSRAFTYVMVIWYS